jgi:paraquat-inducible protein B
MGSKVNPHSIGAFVMGAVMLVIAGLLFFGGGKFFQETFTYVLFFDGSVQGLNVGAPVMFRGVQVGQVARVEAVFDPKEFTFQSRVVVKLVGGAVKVRSGPVQDPHQAMEGLIQQGVRASLHMQSFVTGLLYVELDFHPDTPIQRLGLDPTYPELPTIPSDMDQLKSTLQQAGAELGKLPLEALLNEWLGLFKRAKSLLELPEVTQALTSLPAVVTAAEHLLQQADGQVAPLGTKLGEAADAARVTLEMVRATLADTQKLLRHVDGQVTPLAGSAHDTLATARGTLGQVQRSLVKLTETALPALKQAEQTLGGADTVLHNDLAHTLKALEDAARSIRVLADALQRHPEALLQGKRP